MIRTLLLCAALMCCGAVAQAAANGNTAAKPAGTPGPRTLDEINIEGEIPVPQVLFITARDQRRVVGFHHGLYLKTSLEVGRQTVYPRWIVLNSARPSAAGKETMP